MVTLPVIANTGTTNNLVEAVLSAVGAEVFTEYLEARQDAFFLDIDRGANPAVALAFRLANGFNDNLNFFRGIELAEIPTVDEIRANPFQHFSRLVVGTNVLADEIAAFAPDGEQDSFRRSFDNAKQNGTNLVQSIASAVNADKVVRDAFDSYLRDARDTTQSAIAQLGTNAETGAPDILKPFINSFTGFISDALFAKPRKSGDGKRVSKELHEYNYLNRPVKTYGGIPDDLAAVFADILPDIPTGDVSHIQVMLFLLKLQFIKGSYDAFGLGLGSDPQGVVLNDIENDNFSIFENSGFSYGNFVDAYNARKLLAELKKIVQSVRAANVKEVLTIRGITQSEYVWEILLSLPPAFFRNSAADIVAIEVLNERQVRKFVAGSEIVQPVNASNDIITSIAGYVEWVPNAI